MNASLVFQLRGSASWLHGMLQHWITFSPKSKGNCTGLIFEVKALNGVTPRADMSAKERNSSFDVGTICPLERCPRSFAVYLSYCCGAGVPCMKASGFAIRDHNRRLQISQIFIRMWLIFFPTGLEGGLPTWCFARDVFHWAKPISHQACLVIS